MSDVEVHELSFLAPVPDGHDALVVALQRSANDASLTWFVFDQTAGIIYCDEDLLHPFGTDVLAIRDPIAALKKWSWVVALSSFGRAMGAIVSTKNWGDSNHARTRLFLQPRQPGTAYRG